MWLKTLMSVACAVALSCASIAPAAELRFTAIPDQDTTRLIERFSAVEAYLESQLGIEVTYVPVKSYAASVEAFKNNDVQLAWFGGLSGVQARMAIPGSLAIAQGEEDPYFITYLIANAGTGLTKSEAFPDEIANRSFTFGSQGSTSGRLMPEFFIREYFQKVPDEIFSRVGFSGNHTKTIELVQSGAYEVGAVNYKVWKTELAAGNIDPNKVNIIWETPGYPDYNWSIRGDVETELIKQVTAALLNLEDPEILGLFPRKSFIATSNEAYQPIVDTARAIGIIRE